MRLADGVYFFECGDMVYLRNVNDGQDYSFNSIVYDILGYIKEHPDCNEDALCEHLQQLYEVEDGEEFRKDICRFLNELRDDHLITADGPAIRPNFGIWDQVEQVYESSGQLLSATLELTYRCSEKCIHCYVDDNCAEAPEPELSLEEYRDILHQLREMGCINLLLTGGEVCLRRDFSDIVRYAVDLGFLVDVYTNGISMTQKQFEDLCEIKLNSVSFSLYSGDAAVHDRITQVPGSFEKTLKRVMMFKCAGVDTFIKTVVIQQNLDSLESLFRLGKRLNIAVKPATSISDTHTGQSAQRFRLDTEEKRKKALDLMNRYMGKTTGISKRDLDGSACKAGILTLSIDPYGGVHPCLAFTKPADSVRNKPLREIWEKDAFFHRVRAVRFGDLSEKCRTCTYADYCAVCIGSAFEESGGEFCPECDTCAWAKLKYDSAHDMI